MTRSREKGENEFSAAARREAMRTGEPVEKILARWLAEAKRAKDTERRIKIERAQKFVRKRNQRKRRNRR